MFVVVSNATNFFNKNKTKDALKGRRTILNPSYILAIRLMQFLLSKCLSLRNCGYLLVFQFLQLQLKYLKKFARSFSLCRMPSYRITWLAHFRFSVTQIVSCESFQKQSLSTPSICLITRDLLTKPAKLDRILNAKLLVYSTKAFTQAFRRSIMPEKCENFCKTWTGKFVAYLYNMTKREMFSQMFFPIFIVWFMDFFSISTLKTHMNFKERQLRQQTITITRWKI